MTAHAIYIQWTTNKKKQIIKKKEFKQPNIENSKFYSKLKKCQSQ